MLILFGLCPLTPAVYSVHVYTHSHIIFHLKPSMHACMDGKVLVAAFVVHMQNCGKVALLAHYIPHMQLQALTIGIVVRKRFENT